MKLKQIINESFGQTKKQSMTSEEKRAFLEAVSNYKALGEVVYRNGNLEEAYNSIKNIVETANKLTIDEAGDWFDGVTVARHMKSMNESFKVFQKTIGEVNTLQQRLESAYDEMGEVLGKYYEIKEELDPVGKEDGDIDNDGDEDASDEYLANRRKTVSNAIANESVNEAIAVGQMVKVVDNPHWEAAFGKKGPFKRKVKMIDNDNVFFTDGSNSSMKYVKESVNEIQYKDAVAKFNDELIKHPMVKKAAQHYKKTPAEIVKVLQQRLSTKGNRGGDTKEVSIDFNDTDSGITIKHKMKFNESVNEARSIGKIQNEWTKVSTEMASLAKEYGQADGDAKTNILNNLKKLTATKKSLEKELNIAVAGKDRNVELVVKEGTHGMATKLLQDIVDGNTSKAEGIKLSKKLAQHYIDWIRTSPFGKKNAKLPLYMLVKASFNWGIERGLDSSLKGELNSLKSSIKTMGESTKLSDIYKSL